MVNGSGITTTDSYAATRTVIEMVIFVLSVISSIVS